jgi:hypothetical protein
MSHLNTKHRYVSKFRPVGIGTIPDTVRWDYVEAPRMYGLANRPDLPVSRHTYGVICTDPPLTTQQMDHFGYELHR